jgi:hypothetical protein
MSTQPAALHYAEVLEDFYLGIGRMDATGAAAELRRLHAANIDCIDHFNAIKAERDELLEVLKAFPGVEHALPFKNLCDCGQCEFIRLRRAVIAKAEA